MCVQSIKLHSSCVKTTFENIVWLNLNYPLTSISYPTCNHSNITEESCDVSPHGTMVKTSWFQVLIAVESHSSSRVTVWRYENNSPFMSNADLHSTCQNIETVSSVHLTFNTVPDPFSTPVTREDGGTRKSIISHCVCLFSCIRSAFQGDSSQQRKVHHARLTELPANI